MKLKNKFKIRCSAIGKIMTEPKTKAEKEAGILSKTCLAYVHEWIKEQPEFYGRRNSFSNKYTIKGNECEAESIEFASKFYWWENAVKNEQQFENDFLTGTPDVILQNSVEDIKNSWSEKTFPLFAKKIPIDGYGWQLQGYMELLNKPTAGLIYTLMDAPERQIEREARNKAYELGLDEIEYEMYEEIREQMTFSNFKDELRIKRFFLDRDKEAINLVQQRVEQIRKYIEVL